MRKQRIRRMESHAIYAELFSALVDELLSPWDWTVAERDRVALLAGELRMRQTSISGRQSCTCEDCFTDPAESN